MASDYYARQMSLVELFDWFLTLPHDDINYAIAAGELRRRLTAL